MYKVLSLHFDETLCLWNIFDCEDSNPKQIKCCVKVSAISGIRKQLLTHLSQSLPSGGVYFDQVGSSQICRYALLSSLYMITNEQRLQDIQPLRQVILSCGLLSPKKVQLQSAVLLEHFRHNSTPCAYHLLQLETPTKYAKLTTTRLKYPHRENAEKSARQLREKLPDKRAKATVRCMERRCK